MPYRTRTPSDLISPEGIVITTHRLACLSISILALLAVATPARSAARPQSDSAVRYATSMGAVGFAEHVSDIMRRQAVQDAAGLRPERDNEEKEDRHIQPDRVHMPVNPGSPDAVAFGDLIPGGRSATPLAASQVLSPQTVGLNFTGATLSGTNPTSSFPPDNMGAVGPTQFVVFVNGRLVTFNKSTGVADGVLNADPDVFFSSVVNGSYTSDPRVRYDRLTGRWFLVIINVSTPNRILLAVSDAASNGIITASTTWTYFYIPIDTTPPTISSTCLADYPTLGIDVNALYIGTNDFCGASGSYNGTDAYVIRKSSIMSTGPIVVTAFRQLATASGAGPYTPQGVDNYDPAATEGYIIGEDNASFGLLQLRRISNPGGTPTISANIPISVATWLTPVNSPHLGNTKSATGYLNCVDDRLYAAHIRNGQLWTAHNVGTTYNGAGTGTASRDGVRWYQLNVPVGSGTPTVVQSGLVYTASASNTTDQRNLIIPSIMVSGQGHAAVSVTTAGTSEYANAAVFGRFASDAAGSMQGTTMLTTSTTAYNPASDPGSSGTGRRWGDYSYVSLDPTDDMTMWSVGQFCNATNSYGVRVAKLLAPPPATPSALADIAAGQSSVTLTLTGTSASGSGFYDPGANPPSGRPFSHLAASITASGATGTPPTVVSATYLTPTTVSLVLNASAATANVGSEHYTITITNPDGQTAAAAIVHVTGASTPAATIATGPSASEGNSGTTTFNFTVNLSAAAATPVTVRYLTSDGTATIADNDYVAATDSITIAAGLTSGTIHVNVNGDTKYEPNETFGVTLTGATGGTLGATVAASATIVNDDAVPVVSIASSSSTAEGNSGATPLAFAVTLSNACTNDVWVAWSTSDNTATTADGDYVSASNSLMIPAGQLAGSVSVNVNGDAKYENNESFSVTINSVSGATLGNAVATGTITNDDAMPSLSVDSVQHLEGDSGTTTYHFTVTLSQASGLLTSVDWATADGTATVAGADYPSTTGGLTFAPGVTSQSFDVLVNGDTVQESDETFSVELANAVSATIATGTGIGTITNDDTTPLLAIGDVTALEGTGGLTSFRFPVTLTNPSATPVTVQYLAVDGTATLANADFQPASGTLTIPALAVTDTITVYVVADSCGEPAEAFTVVLSSPVGAAIATGTGTGSILNDDDVTAPAVTLVHPNGAEELEVNGAIAVEWTATDSVGVTSVDLLLSRDGGATYPEVIAAGLPNTGSYLWTVTGPATATAFLQVLAHDGGCNTGSDATDASFTITDHLTGVTLDGPVTAFALGAVQPNPSRGAIQFSYQLPRDAQVHLSVVDVQGREVAVIASGSVAAGRHVATWSGATSGGQAAHGLYFVRYVAGGKVFSRRFALLR
jgi:hypothetical protein